MKKIYIGKITAAKVNQMPFRKQGEPVVGYYGENKDIVLIPQLKYISVVVKKFCNNKPHSHKVGDFSYTKWRELEKRAHDYIANIVNERYQTQSNIIVKQLFLDVVKPYSEENHKDSSGFIQRLQPLIKEFGHKRVCDVTTSDIQKSLNDLAKSRQSPTVSRFRSADSKFFSLAIEHGHIDKNPCAKTKKPPENPSRTRVHSDEEAIAFFDAVINDKNPIHGGCLALSATSGLRQRNVREIELAWLNDDFTVLSIPDSKNNKPIQHQLSPISTGVVKFVLPHSDGTFLFPSRVAGKFMSKPTKCMARARKKVQEITGITEHFYAHDLRRTFATAQLRVTGDINIVRESLGHSDIKMTLIYALNNSDKLRDANTKTAEALLGGRPLSSFIKTTEE